MLALSMCVFFAILCLCSFINECVPCHRLVRACEFYFVGGERDDMRKHRKDLH